LKENEKEKEERRGDERGNFYEWNEELLYCREGKMKGEEN
jgi:hypothetical protein